MVRSSRRLTLLSLFALFLLPACGGDETQTFRVALASPARQRTEVPFPVGVVRGIATGVETLTLRVSAGDETYTFPARPGTSLAFRVGGETPPSPVALAGLDGEAPSASEVVRAFEQRLGERASEPAVRKPVGGSAFVVDLPADREDLWPKIVRSAAPPADVRFLVEVLPRERYHAWRDGRTPPRLASPAAPWPGTAEAFEAFKEAEVERWLEAQAAARPYEPSRAELLVLPRAGTEALVASDFAVLEWPAHPEHRFDGRMLANPVTARDPQTGKPIVLYEVREPYQAAFEAWTGANVGLPMAIVLDWVVRSAPVVNSALRDNVQITLGSGSWSELEAEARALTRSLGASTEGAAPVLVAASTWRPGGALEVLVSLADRVDTTLVVEAQGAAPDEMARVERTLRLVPGIEADAADAVDARLSETLLGTLEAAAAAPLLRADAAAAVEQLARVASGDVSNVRRRAAATLLGLLDPRSETAIRALVGLIDDADPELAAVAADALGEPAKADDAAFEALLRGATSSEVRVRHAAVSALGEVRTERREDLLARADDPDLAVREAVLMAFSSFGVSGDGEWEEWLLPVYLSRLRDENAGMRRMALMNLHELVAAEAKGAREHVDEIAACLEDVDLQVRLGAAACIGQLQAEAYPVLAPYLDAERPAVRAAALSALLAIEEPTEAMRRRIDAAPEDPALVVRLTVAAMRAMKQDDLAGALRLAREGLASDDPAERQMALGIVWWGGAEAAEAAPWLEPLLDDADDETRVMAAASLQRVGEETARSREILAAVRADAAHPLHGLVVSLDQQGESGR